MLDNITQESLVGTEDSFLNKLQGLDVLSQEAVGSSNSDNKNHRDVASVLIEARRYILKDPKDTPYRWFEVFTWYYKNKVSLNGWTGEYHLVSKEVTIEELIDRLETDLRIIMPLSADQFRRKFKVWISNYTFNPVKKELDRIMKDSTYIWVHPGTDLSKLPEAKEYRNRRGQLTHKDSILSTGGYVVTEFKPMADWHNLALKIFGVDDKLSQIFLETWLIQAIARGVKPGCQADLCLVLKGKQGAGKSSFFRDLGGEYFVDIESTNENLELFRKLNSAWICEMGEMEGITRKKEVTELKAFITKTQDVYREMYAHDHSKHPRHCVFAGTCNSSEILKDDTGNRRFLVIEIPGKVNRQYVIDNREDILATAYYYYLNGAKCYLDDQITQESEERNSNYMETNEWMPKIHSSLAKLQSHMERQNASQASKANYNPKDGLNIELAAFMEYCLLIPMRDYSSFNKKIVRALTELGYTKRKLNYNGTRSYFYVQGSPENPYWVTGDSLASLNL